MQGYISFIANSGLKDKCARARELLLILERDFPDFKLERRLYLQFQILALDTGKASIPEDLIASLMELWRRDPTNDQNWAYVMQAAGMLGRDDLLRGSHRLALEHGPAGSEPYYTYSQSARSPTNWREFSRDRTWTGKRQKSTGACSRIKRPSTPATSMP